MEAPAPVGVAPPMTNTLDTPGSAMKLRATRSVLPRVSARVAPGGSSRLSTMRLSSCAGMKPVDSSVVDHSETANSAIPTPSVTYGQARVAASNRW